MQHPSPTPAVQRISTRFQQLLSGDDRTDAGYLVLCVVAEESLGAGCLQTLGASLDAIQRGCLGPSVAAAAAELAPLTEFEQQPRDLPAWMLQLIEKASAIARRSPDEHSVGSSHLVRAMVEVDGPARDQLNVLGIDQTAVERCLGIAADEAAALTVDFDLQTSDTSPLPSIEFHRPDTSSVVVEGSVAALIDANLNRAREGLRVLEDFSRFVLRNASTTQQLKTLRHDLVSTERHLPGNTPYVQQARNVAADVGTGLSHRNERDRSSVRDVLKANARRVQEALRSLEEFGKLVSVDFAAGVKQVRYRSYDVEQQLMAELSGSAIALPAATRIRQLLNSARLYVLLTEELCALPWKQAAERTLDGGVEVLQLREKQLPEAELAKRADWLQALCRERDVVFVLNDRADLAESNGCDAVHLGQEDLLQYSVSDDRTLPVIGLSTHNESQLHAALPVADYLGVGPVFPSTTKQFHQFAGLDFVRLASEQCPLPWFAIGGIDQHNLPEVTDAGAKAIAVSSAVVGTDAPQAAAEQLRMQLLETLPEQESPL